MSPAIIDAAIIVALLGGMTATTGNLMLRLSRLERRERALWAWARSVVDLYYRYRRDGAPDPPELPDEE